MKRPVFAANWKMNLGPSDARPYLRTFLAHYARRTDRTVAFFPPSLTLCAVVDVLRDRTDILTGVQNIFWEPNGAFTGETSAPIARDAGASLALVGHSERRHIFGETDEQSAAKCVAAFRAGLTPVLCVGERLDERDRGQAEEVVLRQLGAATSVLEPAQVGKMLIAYEPVWAIGTGKNATPEDATAMHRLIRATVRTQIGRQAEEIPILYGGSVNRNNARALLDAPEVDGLLVGGASLDPEGFAAIVRT